jgi:hypothetical protein
MGIISQIVAIGAHFLNKSAWVEGAVAFSRRGESRSKEIQKIFRTCAGYVKEATFFFDVTFFDCTGQG